MSNPNYGYSLEGLGGEVDHYNADGSFAGWSTEVNGSYDHYNADGSFAGFSIPVIGSYNHYLNMEDDINEFWYDPAWDDGGL